MVREMDNCETLLEGMNRGQKKVRKVHILGKASCKSIAEETTGTKPRGNLETWQERAPETRDKGEMAIGKKWTWKATQVYLFGIAEQSVNSKILVV